MAVRDYVLSHRVFPALLKPQGSNAIRAVTNVNTVITKANMVGGKDNSNRTSTHRDLGKMCGSRDVVRSSAPKGRHKSCSQNAKRTSQVGEFSNSVLLASPTSLVCDRRTQPRHAYCPVPA